MKNYSINPKKYNINSPDDLMNFFTKNIQYGFTYRNKVFTDNEPDFQQNMDKLYKIRLGEDLIKSGYGVCWDLCELERSFLEELNIKHLSYFMEGFIDEYNQPTHTFVLFERENKCYWFEYAWEYYRGLHEYNSIESALEDIIKKYKAFYNNKLQNVEIYLYPKINNRLNVEEFVMHCKDTENIRIL